MRRFPPRRPSDTGEFLWLVSLSDLMILLFIFFVVLFSFSYKKMQQADIQRMVATLGNQKPVANPIDELRNKLNAWVQDQNLSEQVAVHKQDDAVLVEIKDQVFFPSGEFHLYDAGIVKLKSLSRTLEKIPEAYHLGIEGHTDDIPIHTKTIEDNWELSAKRALAVLNALNLSPALLKRTTVMGHGDTVPIAPNRDPAGLSIPENQSRNRRVTLRIF